MKKTIYALGVFDGVHVGHGELLRQCRGLSQAYGCLAGAVTFGTHPDTQVLGKAPLLLSSLRDRKRLLETRFSMDTVVVLPFDEKMCRMSWQDFLALLTQDYGAAGFVCGADFRFGSRGLGNASLLEDYCKDRGLPSRVVPEQTIHGIRVSSTHIRSLLERGMPEEAALVLGHPHILTAVPDARGSFCLPPELVRPKAGTYQARLHAGETHKEIRLQISEDGTVRTDAPEAAFGREVTVELLSFLG